VGKNLEAMWGKLAAEILTQNWESAMSDVYQIRDLIDNASSKTTPLQQLQQRSWLVHFSLFVFFNHPRGRDGIVDLFFSSAYINTIQTTSPWILRYLTTAVITNKRRRNQLKDLHKVIQTERYQYHDPITEFIHHLYVDCDFDGAQKSLSECEEVGSICFLVPRMSFQDYFYNKPFHFDRCSPMIISSSPPDKILFKMHACSCLKFIVEFTNALTFRKCCRIFGEQFNSYPM
jgi:hypothetical protein